jgi:hypothetical protein
VADKPYALLSAYLWDLRANAESKLRCLTRLQQELARLEHATHPEHRAAARLKIMADLNDILTISQTLRSVSEEALAAAVKLPE